MSTTRTRNEPAEPLPLVIGELEQWPSDYTLRIDELRDRLRRLIGREVLDAQSVAWVLDVDGRYGSVPLAEKGE